MSGLNISRGSSRLFNYQTNYFLTSNNQDSNYTNNAYSILLSYFFISTRGCNTSSPNPWFDVATLNCISNCNAGTVETLSGTAKYCKDCHYSCKACTLGALA